MTTMRMKRNLVIMWIQTLAILVFLYGFLPLKEPSEDKATIEDIPKEAQSDWLRRKVGQIVVVVIDALRADFVLPEATLEAELGLKRLQPSKMKYLHNALRKNDDDEKIAFLSRANAPTVTMPRLKALMSGTIPGFIDVILNFGSKELQEDNLIEQWKRHNRNVIMYGDDTWLKLFPNHFSRSEGTTSFFVSDFTEVDNNVTRHLKTELHKDDWDVMVLHYLGLDHIGHVTGPDGPEIPKKLEEMSGIVQSIFETLSKKKAWKNDLPPLVLVLGDHGMADQGGHGGSSISEIFTPLVFLTPLELKPKLKSIKQYDLVPNLAYLTGVPIPCHSLGSLIFQTNAQAESYNRQQIAKVIGSKKSNLENLDEEIFEYEKKMVEYNLSMMILGIVISLSTCLMTFELDFLKSKINSFCILHLFSYISTSFIEEEYLAIFYICSTLILYQSWQKSTLEWKKCLVALFLLRISQTLNQTGDKWSHLPDFGDWLRIPANWPFLTMVLLAGGLLLVAIEAKNEGKLTSILIVLSLMQKITDLFELRWTMPTTIIYISSTMSLAFYFYSKSHTLLRQTWLPILVLLTQPHNMILLPFHICLENVIKRLQFHSEELANVYNFFGWTLFFQLGNSNSLASIDVGVAYTGLSSFNPVIVGSLLAVSTFTGPLLWSICLLERLLYSKAKERYCISQISSLIFFRGLQITFYLTEVTLQRQHLFIWTVFSPKLLYLAMAVLVINVFYTLSILPHIFKRPIKNQ